MDSWLEAFHADILQAPTHEAIQKRRRRFETQRSVAGTLLKLLIFVGALYLVFSTAFGFFRVAGNAMRPTAGDGDLALTTRIFDSLETNDLVVYEHGGVLQLGRLVAQPGDSVEIDDDGDLLVNGNLQASVTQEATEKGSGSFEYPVVLGDGQYFILNDDRSSTQDSRELGPVGLNEVKGKLIALLRLREI